MMEYKIEDNRIRWAFKGEEVLAEVCGTESIRVRASFGNPVDEKRNHNLKKNEDLEGKACLTKEGAMLCAGNLRAEIYDEGRVTFYYRDKKILKEMWIDEKNGMPPFQRAREYKGISGERFHLQIFFEPSEEEHIYGMGQENTGCFDLKGCTVDLCQKNTKCTIPFYISTLGYGFVWNNPAVGRAEFVKNRTLWEARMSRQLDYVVIGGGEPRRIMEYYTELTGRMPEVPDWIFGLWQSRLRYRTQKELLEVAREYRRRQIPLSVIVLDYFHWPYQGDWRFDEEYFPDPGAMVEELNEAGVCLMVSVWPTVDRRSENYRNLEEMGGLITSERGPDVLFMCRGAETYVDMTNPGAADVLWEKLRDNYVEYGISSFWLDEAEPEIYPYDYENMRLRIGNGLEGSNYYPYAYSAGVEERLRKDNIWSGDGDRQTDGINLVRSGWIGSQKLRAVIWSGDVPSTFESFKNQLVAGLHMSMCGIPLWTTDIGGFYGGDPEEKEFRELMIRWFQFGTFCPIMRMHGYRKPYVEKGNMDDMSGECSSGGPNEIWSFGEEAYGIMLNYIQIRDKMIPYIKEQLTITRRTGTPIMRPLVYDYPGDANVYDLADEYLFGEKVLAAPVMEYGLRTRKVYLPEGRWKSNYTGKIHEGKCIVEEHAPLDHMPVFEKWC